jgi:hypothetical protein
MPLIQQSTLCAGFIRLLMVDQPGWAETEGEAWSGYATRRAQAKQSMDAPGIVSLLRSQAEAQAKTRTGTVTKSMAGKLNSMGDDAQLTNVDLQKML